MNKRWLQMLIVALVAPTFPLMVQAQAPLGTSLTYQGQLKQGGLPVINTADFQFKLYDALEAGNQIGGTISVDAANVENGLFTASLDFGAGCFDGNARWIEIAVRVPAGAGAYTTLSPRQELTGSPYALYGLDTQRVRGREVSSTAPANGQVLKWNGVAWSPAADNDTTYTAGTGLSLAGTQFSLNTAYTDSLYVNEGQANSITNAMIQNAVVTTAKLGSIAGYALDTDYNGTLVSLINGYASQVTLNVRADQNNGIAVNTYADGTGTALRGGTWNGHGVEGFCNNTGTDAGDAIYGYSKGGIGVHGKSDSDYGVYGESSSGHGAHGHAAGTNGRGLYGLADGPLGPVYGVYGLASTADDDVVGVYGEASASGSTYLTRGGYFVSRAAGGHGVDGWATATSGISVGGWFESASAGDGWGVYGHASAATGPTIGVYAESESTGGMGLYAVADANSGTNYAVYARTDSADGYAGFFVGGHGTVATRVGAGRTAAVNTLEVEGNASKTVAGDWLANSDARIKTDVENVTKALDTLDRVRLVSFRYTDDYRREHTDIADRRYLNVIAQEFATVFPECVRAGGDKLPDGSPILQVDPYPLTIYSAAATQELHQMLKEKDAEIAALRQRSDELAARLVAVEELVAELTSIEKAK